MTRRTFTIVATLLVLLGAAVRIHNGMSFPVLAGYDGFGHFTYVWFMAETWRVPLPTSGWDFFHPPVYYALMAGLWSALSDVDPILRLRIGLAAVAVASLVHTFGVWAIVRRRFPADQPLRLLAGSFVLFLPVQIYGAEFLGNETLNGVVCGLAFLALLAHLRAPSWPRSLGLGAVLGLAMLTKFTAIAVVAGALATVAGQGIYRRQLWVASRHLLLVVVALLTICGWYYARNLARYGSPFVMSRGELMVRLVEGSQPVVRRSAAEYLLFDPMIFRRPNYPRGVADPAGAGGWSQSLRDSVWTGLYANTWFDAFGGWAIPRVTENERARRVGQGLLILGAVPTLVVLLGIGTAIARLRRRGWDDLLGATLLTLTPMLLIFLVATRTVANPGTVKATYLAPVTVAFGVCFALGVDRLRGWWPRSFPWLAANVALVSMLSVAAFWHGLLFDDRDIRGSFPLIAAATANQTGVVYYAGGDRPTAHRYFAQAAAEGLYLGEENLALLAFGAGQADAALHHLKRALRLQPAQSFGRLADRALYDRGTRAEYLNLVAVFEHGRGRSDRARRAADVAVRLDPALPEAHYDLAVALLGDPALRARAREHLDRALALDPGFAEARSLGRMIEVGCGAGVAAPVWVRTAPGGRRYPVETGPGAPHAAAIGRRRHIEDPPERLRAALCSRA